MRGAFGKPQGTVARVRIGQVIMSVRTKANNKEHIIEALRRAKFKFPGRQKVLLKLTTSAFFGGVMWVTDVTCSLLSRPVRFLSFPGAQRLQTATLWFVYALGWAVPSLERDH